MKKLIFLLLLIIPLAGFSQPFKGFFKPVTPQLFETHYRSVGAMGAKTGTWLFRPQVSITAIQLNYDKLAKKVVAKDFTNAGVGIGYSHYTLVNGEVFQNYGINVLVLFGQEQPVDLMKSYSVSFAAVFNALGWVNLGPVFDLGSKKLGLLTGVSIRF